MYVAHTHIYIYIHIHISKYIGGILHLYGTFSPVLSGSIWDYFSGIKQPGGKTGLLHERFIRECQVPSIERHQFHTSSTPSAAVFEMLW